MLETVSYPYGEGDAVGDIIGVLRAYSLESTLTKVLYDFLTPESW